MTNPLVRKSVDTTGGIHDGDLLIVDRAIEPKHGDIVIAGFHGELTCKRLETDPILQLVPMNPNYPKIRVPDDTELDIHGIVLHVLPSEFAFCLVDLA